MVFGFLTETGNSGFAESNGFYDRIPIRVGEYSLVENEKDKLVFETTAQEHCDDGPKVTVSISKDDGWSVNASQGCYMWNVTPSVELTKDRLERRRAFWHAAQYMIGRELNYKETFSTRRQIEDEADLFEDDAFFKNGNAVTNDPFSEFLEDR